MSNEIKIEKLINFVSDILDPITHNDKAKGYIILSLHYILGIIYFILIFKAKINAINITLLLIIVIIHFSLNIYYKKFSTCILVKLERKFFNDKHWFGPLYPLFDLFSYATWDNYRNYIHYIIIYSWIILAIFYIYRVYNELIIHKFCK
tara:strand:+ start:1684 stop:2130 length:447 start_codon:yes stop_codon:yes gene_type:complete